MPIIANPFTLTEFLLDSLPPAQRAGVLTHPKRIKGVAYSLLKALDAWCPFRLPGFRPFPEAYLQALQAIPEQAPVLIFGIENIKDLRILRKYLRTRRIAVFTWNPVIDYQQNHRVRQLHIQHAVISANQFTGSIVVEGSVGGTVAVQALQVTVNGQDNLAIRLYGMQFAVIANVSASRIKAEILGSVAVESNHSQVVDAIQRVKSA